MMGPKGGERDWLALGREVLEVEAEGLARVRERLGEGFERALRLLASCRGRVVVTGLGKSGLVGRKIAATLSSTGTPAFFLHPVEGAHGDLGMLRGDDVALAISNSGETDELNAILPAMRSVGVRVVAITTPGSSLARLADEVVDAGVEREACPMNLAPTASTTAALAVGDALAVCLIHWHQFSSDDFQRCHPGGSLGQRLRLSIADLMHTGDIPAAIDDTPFGQALERLNAGGLGALALTGPDGRLTGILTDGDVRRAVCNGKADSSLPVSEVMTKAPSAASPGHSAAQVLDLMEERAITVVPVVDEQGRLAGMVHLHDLLGKGFLKFAG